VKLTNPQLSYLSRAFDLTLRFGGPPDWCVGVFGNLKNGGRVCGRLVELGLLEHAGYGHDIDGVRDGEFPVYACTDAGAAELLARREVTEADVAEWRRRARLNLGRFNAETSAGEP
jgi:hypothetical protein